MKAILKSLVLITLIFGSTSVTAQKSKKGNPNELKFIKSLSKSQKAEWDEYMTFVKADKKALKDTYTEEQLAIAKDKTLAKAARKKNLIATYTPEQAALSEANATRRSVAKKAFKSTFSERQKMLWKRWKSNSKSKKNKSE